MELLRVMLRFLAGSGFSESNFLLRKEWDSVEGCRRHYLHDASPTYSQTSAFHLHTLTSLHTLLCVKTNIETRTVLSLKEFQILSFVVKIFGGKRFLRVNLPITEGMR
jgi:hypothetical protein